MTNAVEATVITPAYNEEAALPTVLAALEPLRRGSVEVIVVDDGSTDRTRDVAEAAGFSVLQLATNQGKADAVRAGLAVAMGRKIIVVDSDGTYPVNAIPAIIGLLDRFDIVLGARITGRDNIPVLNRYGNTALRTAIHWFSGFGSKDPLTGLYGIRREHLEAMDLKSPGFGLEAEICVKAARMGLRWTDHPITYAERVGESKLSPIRDGLVITSTVVKTLFSGPRVPPAPGRAPRIRPAPLAMVATGASVAVLTVAVLILATITVLAVASLLGADVDASPGIAIAGAATMAVGLALWRLAHRWGRPGLKMMGLLAPAGVALGAVTLGIGVFGADRLGFLSDRPGIEATLTGLAVGGILATAVAGIAVPVGRVATRREWRMEVGESTRSVMRRHGEWLALAAIGVYFALPVVRLIAIDAVIGFDEAIYANTARSWLEGTPNTGWSPHRSPGISALGVLAAPIGEVSAFRVIGLISGLAMIVGGWALARRMGGVAAGLFAALLIAGIPELQLQSGWLLTDVPSAAIMLFVMLLAWVQLEERRHPTMLLLGLAPLAAAACYVRYGASVAIVLTAVTGLILWHAKLRRALWLALATAALFALLLLPHLIQATMQTGRPWGIAEMAQSLASPAYPGEALRVYLSRFPGRLAGWPGDIAMLVAVAGWLSLLARLGLRKTVSRGVTFLVVPALLQFLLLGITTLPQLRYVLLPMALLVTAGCVVAVRLARRLAPGWRRSLAIAVVVPSIAIGLSQASVTMHRQADAAPSQFNLADVGRAIANDAGGASCSVLGYPPPALTWYSACAVHHYGFPPTASHEEELEPGRRYLVLTTADSPRYPSGALRDDYLALAEDGPFAVIRDHVSGEPEFEVYRLPDGP